MARLYQPIWMLIKKNKICTIRIEHPALVARVKKAVIKEKDLDLAFKVMNDHDDVRLVISYDAKKQEMTFRLKQKLGIEELHVV